MKDLRQQPRSYFLPLAFVCTGEHIPGLFRFNLIKDRPFYRWRRYDGFQRAGTQNERLCSRLQLLLALRAAGEKVRLELNKIVAVKAAEGVNVRQF
jgi:hypothetical protein